MNIFKWLFRKKEKSTPQFSSVPEKSYQPYIQQTNNQSQSIVHKFDAGIIPSNVDNIPIAYRRFKTDIISQNTLIYEKMQKSGDFSILAEEKNGKILLYYYEEFYAIVNDEQTEAMIKDWIRNKEPFLIYANSSDTVYVALYRDKRKKMAYREHEVVKLTAFSSNAKQETISFLEDGEELNIEEDYDNNTSGRNYTGNARGNFFFTAKEGLCPIIPAALEATNGVEPRKLSLLHGNRRANGQKNT